MSYSINQDRQRQAIIGSITALMHNLQQLAPHPDQPHNKGPLFIKSNPNFKIANDHDGMLGNMMLEGFLGTAFTEAVSDTFGSWTQNFDATAMLECYSEYLTCKEEDKEDTQEIAAHGQGTLARMSGKSISNNFNMRGSMTDKMHNFMEDMPKRMKIERDLAYYAKQLEILDAEAAQYTPQRPSFAA